MKCIYHSKDLDGIMGGYIVKRAFRNCEMIPYDYIDELPVNKLKDGDKDETIIVVDISLRIDQLSALLSYKKIIWIDHHIKSKEVYENILNSENALSKSRLVDFYFNTDVSACYLAYQYFNKNKKVPVGITLLSLYDTGKIDDKRVIPFNYGVKSFDPLNDESILNDIYNGSANLKNIIEIGKRIEKYHHFFLELNFGSMANEVSFGGKSAIAVNIIGIDSFILYKYWNKKYDLLILYYRTMDKKWKVSVYSRSSDINVSELCSKYGGGGHAKAGGFKTSVLPFAI